MKFIVLLTVFFSLTAVAQEIGQYECSSNFSRATIEINKTCASITIEKKERSRINCPRCKGTTSDTYLPEHEFNTCAYFYDHLTVAESNEVDGKNFEVSTSSLTHYRLGHVNKYMKLTFLERQDDSDYLLKDVYTSIVGGGGNVTNLQYKLAPLHKYMTCKKVQ